VELWRDALQQLAAGVARWIFCSRCAQGGVEEAISVASAVALFCVIYGGRLRSRVWGVGVAKRYFVIGLCTGVSLEFTF